MAAEQLDHFGEVVVAILPMLSAPNRAVLSGSHIEGKLNVRAKICRRAVFMEHIDHLGIPRRSEASVVVAVNISLDEQDMIIPICPNRLGQTDVELTQEGSSWEVPVGFVDQVVSRDPRLIFVALGKPIPKPDGLAAIPWTFPKRILTQDIITDPTVAALSAGCGVQVEDDVDLGCCAPRDNVV